MKPKKKRGGVRRPEIPREQLRALRCALGLTQHEVAERAVAAGQPLDRLIVLAVEGGRNKLTSRSTFAGMARGLGVEAEELDALLHGRQTAEALARLVLAREPDLAARLVAVVGAP